MCRFITAVVPPDFDFNKVKPLLDKHAMSFQAIANTCVEAQLGGDRLVRATFSVCDCHSGLGTAGKGEVLPTAASDLAHVQKLKKKGWSEHKIERWLAEQNSSLERHQKDKRTKYDTELKAWRQFIEAMLASGAVKRMGLMLHTYHGLLEEEPISIKAREELALSESFEETLLAMDEDVIYMIWPLAAKRSKLLL